MVYARVEATSRDMEPELSCMVTHGPKRDWMTGQSVYGELRQGHAFQCSLSLAQSLLDENCVVLQALAASIPFEIAVGVNGWIWVNAGTVREIILVSNAILKSETIPDSAVPAMVLALLKRGKKQHQRGGKHS